MIEHVCPPWIVQSSVLSYGCAGCVDAGAPAVSTAFTVLAKLMQQYPDVLDYASDDSVNDWLNTGVH